MTPAESVALRALRIMAAIVQSQCNDADFVTVDGQTFTIGSALDTANALLEPAVVAESAEQRAVAERDAFIAAYRSADPSALLSEAQRAWDGVAGCMWRYRASLAASPAATAPCATREMVGLTDADLLNWLESHATDVNGINETEEGIVAFSWDAESDGPLREALRAALAAKGRV